MCYFVTNIIANEPWPRICVSTVVYVLESIAREVTTEEEFVFLFDCQNSHLYVLCAQKESPY